MEATEGEQVEHNGQLIEFMCGLYYFPQVLFYIDPQKELKFFKVTNALILTPKASTAVQSYQDNKSKLLIRLLHKPYGAIYKVNLT